MDGNWYDVFAAESFRMISFLLVVAAALALVLVGGQLAFEGRERQLDVQTFALLIGGAGYFIGRVLGRPRPAAIEIAFVWTACGAVYAALSRDAPNYVLATLGYAVALAGVGYVIRVSLVPFMAKKPELEDTSEASSVETPASSREIRIMLDTTETRLREAAGRKVWVAAFAAGVVAAALGQVIARER
jgi:hypothetical protein